MTAMADPATVFDYLVIGSGFGGSVSAMRLAEYAMSQIPPAPGSPRRPQPADTSTAR